MQLFIVNKHNQRVRRLLMVPYKASILKYRYLVAAWWNISISRRVLGFRFCCSWVSKELNLHHSSSTFHKTTWYNSYNVLHVGTLHWHNDKLLKQLSR